jgi:hypothetical protein
MWIEATSRTSITYFHITLATVTTFISTREWNIACGKVKKTESYMYFVQIYKKKDKTILVIGCGGP